MPSPLEAAGAAHEPTEYAALSMDTQFTGMWTQRNPLRDADVPYLYRKFYSAGRIDSIIDGLNREITAALTDKRRPGNPVYNSATFPSCNSMYPFKWIQNSAEVLRVLYDGTDGKIYDATAGQKSTLFTKSAGAKKTRFLGINTELFFSDTVDLKKYVQSSLAWLANTLFTQGQFIVDTNLNLQVAVGAQTATITNVAVVTEGGTTRSVILYFSPTTPVSVPVNGFFTLSGLTTVPSLNGHTVQVQNTPNNLQYQCGAPIGTTLTAYTTETGSATTGTGVTGGSQPTWNTNVGFITQDGGEQWLNKGSAIQNWGIAAPTLAPSVTQSLAPSIYPAWAANTWYAPSFVVVDSNSNLQVLITSGTTGAGVPTWNVTVGGTTNDGTAQWKNLGPGTWAANTVYAVGAYVNVTYSYTITYQQFQVTGPNGQGQLVTVQQIITVTNLFKCITGGTSTTNTMGPSWTDGLNTTTVDNTVIWQNLGSAATWATFGATQLVSTAATVVSTGTGAGFQQNATVLGKTGSSAPTWATALGSPTTDTGTPIAQIWSNAGAISPGNPAGAWTYAYSGKNSITGHISTASPLSLPITVPPGYVPVIQGQGLSDPQIDQLVLWRTAQGQSTLIYLDTIPNYGSGNTWTYTDTKTDLQLNAFIAAPVNHANDPPPAGATAPEFHDRRIFMIYQNFVIWSGGPATTTGSGYEAFAPLNSAPFPAQPVRLKSKTLSNGGLVVYTTDGAYCINGTGTTTNPFFVSKYEEAVAIAGYDALATLGTTDYFMESNGKVSSFDPSNGYVEIGFPIGDQFQNVTTGSDPTAPTGQLYNASTTFLTWNLQSSGESAMYVSDGAVGWFRYSPIAPPESGSLWSPRAAIIGGTSAVQSIETAPGVWNLLIAPKTSGPILMRDTTNTVWQDNGNSYPSWDAKGVIRLCDTGQIAEVAHVALKSRATGNRPIASILMGEIAPSNQVPWDALNPTSEDPPTIPLSQSMYSDRYEALQNGETPKGDCMQLKVDYGTQAFGDELLLFGIYGKKQEERVQQ